MLAYWGAGALKRRSLWDADHILPVCEGGGECDLENLRTLCLVCHQDATSALRRRRARVRSSPAAGVPGSGYLPMPEKSTLGGCAAAGVAVK